MDIPSDLLWAQQAMVRVSCLRLMIATPVLRGGAHIFSWAHFDEPTPVLSRLSGSFPMLWMVCSSLLGLRSILDVCDQRISCSPFSTVMGIMHITLCQLEMEYWVVIERWQGGSETYFCLIYEKIFGYSFELMKHRNVYRGEDIPVPEPMIPPGKKLYICCWYRLICLALGMSTLV